MRITISGLAGSGTSTVSKILSKKLKIRHIDAGQIWDKMAAEKNVDVLGLSKLAENDNSIDKDVDNRMLDYARKYKNIILEGRLIGALCSQNMINSLKIWIMAPLDIRAKRVCQREKDNFDRIKENIIQREKSNARRYLKYYNIDISNKSFYDLVINSEKINPEEISELILYKVNKEFK